MPLSVDMTVLDAFVAATQKYRNTTSSNVDEIPFNVVLDWDNKLKCYIVVKAVGIENKRKQAWFFTVRDLMFEVCYFSLFLLSYWINKMLIKQDNKIVNQLNNKMFIK